jgi:3-isopropylmalate/(R)-2-methylmalate dehydratase small subunit
MKQPDFELRRPEYADAGILLAGRNFGSGSSREHAAWALQDYGFEVVIAPSFGDIFRTNALKIGLLPIVLPAKDVDVLMRAVAGGESLTVDLEAQEVAGPDDLVVPFEFEPFARESLLQGLDDIALTLKREETITAFERTHVAPVDTTALPV